MAVTVDTNALIHFFTNDVPRKADLVENLFKKEKNIFIPDVIFPELEYILGNEYKFSRDQLLDIFNSLLSRSNLHINSVVKIAVQIFSQTKLDMADCIIAASSLKGKLASFDKELLGVKEINSFWK